MADLKKYVWEGLTSGQAVDIYLNRWPKIGSGVIDIIENLHLKCTGSGGIFGFTIKGSIEIRMPDTSSNGVCKVSLNGGTEESCKYQVSDGKLQINHSKTQITMYDNDKKWSWVHINNPVSAWAGIWPAGMNTEDADHFSQPSI